MTDLGSLRGSSTVPRYIDPSSLAEETAKWEIDPTGIEIGEQVGSGSFGSVYKGRLRGKPVAVKKIRPMAGSSFDQKTIDTFRMEVVLMSKLRHPNVLLFMGAAIEPDCLMIVTELMSSGSIQDLLKNPKQAKALNFAQRMKMAKDAALGMNWLHLSNPVDANNFVKVADFGLTVVKENEKESLGAMGTPVYMAPEVILGEPYDESCDVYSFGLVLWELYTGQSPYQDIHSMEELQHKVCKQNLRPTIPDNCPKSFKEMMEKCWHADPKQRPKFQQLIEDLDYVIVEGTIKEPLGFKFWHTNLKGKYKLPFSEFLPKFCQFLNIKPPVRGQPALEPSSIGYKCLQALLTKPPLDEVTMESFDDFSQWFGPLVPNRSFLEKVESLLSSEWFHGDVSAEEAERALVSSNKPGTYLVRFSSQPGSFTVSSLSRNMTVKMFRVHRKGDKYELGEEQFPSLKDLLLQKQKELTTFQPCKNSKYSWIFKPEEASKAQYLVD